MEYDILLGVYDYLVLIGYVVLSIVVAQYFRKFTKSFSDYTNASSSVKWWMIGATAFMTQFSIWTFIAGADKAFQDGFLIMVLFWGNGLGFLLASRYIAPKFQQLGIQTIEQSMRLRYGAINQQVFMWLNLIAQLIGTSIKINAMAIFISIIFGIPIYITIPLICFIIILVSFSGGLWSITGGNVMQLFVVISITIAIGISILWQLDLTKFTTYIFPYPYNPKDTQIDTIMIILWCVFILLKQILSTNSPQSAFRYLNANTPQDAKKAAIFSGVLFLIIPMFWFLPPWFSSFSALDLTSMYPNLERVGSAAYFAPIHFNNLIGISGLILAIMIAATISPISTSLNLMGNVFMRNFYLIYIRKEAKEKESLITVKIFTLFFSLLVMFFSLYLSTLSNIGLFNIMMIFGTLLLVPITIPQLFGLFIKKIPDWAAWSSVLVGLCVSFISVQFLTLENVFTWFNIKGSFGLRSLENWDVIISMTMHLFITLPYYLSTRFFYKKEKNKRLEEKEDFFARLNQKVFKEKIINNYSKLQIRIIAFFLSINALGLIIIQFLFPPLAIIEKQIFLMSASFLIAISIFLILTEIKIKKYL